MYIHDIYLYGSYECVYRAFLSMHTGILWILTYSALLSFILGILRVHRSYSAAFLSMYIGLRWLCIYGLFECVPRALPRVLDDFVLYTGLFWGCTGLLWVCVQGSFECVYRDRWSVHRGLFFVFRDRLSVKAFWEYLDHVPRLFWVCLLGSFWCVCWALLSITWESFENLRVHWALLSVYIGLLWKSSSLECVHSALLSVTYTRYSQRSPMCVVLYCVLPRALLRTCGYFGLFWVCA